MLILAIDLGKTKSLACWYRSDGATHEFRTVPTRPGESACGECRRRQGR